VVSGLTDVQQDRNMHAGREVVSKQRVVKKSGAQHADTSSSKLIESV
jgi:hypothetical protein